VRASHWAEVTYHFLSFFFIFVGKTYPFLEQVRYIFASTPRAYIYSKNKTNPGTSTRWHFL
jgi:hypothetical protein